MKKMLKKNFQYGVLLSSLALTLASMSACTDYVDEYDSQYKSVYGDDATIDSKTPVYSSECDNVLWLAYDGKDYMEETTLGTKWEYFRESPSDIEFTGLDENNIRFNVNFLMDYLTPYLKLDGGISGKLKIDNGAKDFYAGLRFGLGDLDLSDGNKVEGVCLTFRTSYYETTMSLMDVDENGNVKSEYRTDPIGETSTKTKTGVKTVKLPLESFKHKSGEKKFGEFLKQANYLGVLFTATKSNDEGFLIVGVGTYGSGVVEESSDSDDEPIESSDSKIEPKSSESGTVTKKSSASTAKSSASTAKSSASKTKSSASKTASSSSADLFYWRGDSGKTHIHTTFEDANSGWWFSYTDSVSGGGSYFQWPDILYEKTDSVLNLSGHVSKVMNVCNGICGASHLRFGFTPPYEALAFAISSNQSGENVLDWKGVCVTYASETPIILRLDVAGADNYNYQMPYYVLPASVNETEIIARKIEWTDFDSANVELSGSQAATFLHQLEFLFSDLEHNDAYFNIFEVGELDACEHPEVPIKPVDMDQIMEKDVLEDNSYDAGIKDEDILWYGGNRFKGKKSTSDEVKWTWIDKVPDQGVTLPKKDENLNMDSFGEECHGGICGEIDGLVNESNYGMGIEFNDSVDVSLFGGVCITYKTTIEDGMYLSLNGDDDYMNSIDYSSYRKYLDVAEDLTTSCIPWENFMWVGNDDKKVKLGEYVKNVKGIQIQFETWSGYNPRGKFNIVAVGKYSDNSEEGLKFLNGKENSVSAWDYLNPNLGYDEFTDDRDKQVYKTIQIGDQVWMAENLNYAASGAECAEISQHGNPDHFSNCNIYGRGYTWEQAQDACPEGWRLPSNWDYQTLFKFAGQDDEEGLLRANTNLWAEGSGKTPNPGSNELGFSALPIRYGADAWFWTSEDSSETLAYVAAITTYGTEIREDDGVTKKELLYPIRCLRNAPIQTDLFSSDIAWYGGNRYNESLLSDETVGTSDFHNGNVTVPGNDGLEQYDTYPETSIELCGGAICGTVNKRNTTEGAEEYPVITFNVSSEGKDITDWGGLCVTYSADSAGVQFTVGDNSNLYYVVNLPEAKEVRTECFYWSQFYPVGNGPYEAFSSYLAHVNYVSFNLSSLVGGGDFKIVAIGQYSTQFDQPENNLNSSCYISTADESNDSAVWLAYVDGVSNFFTFKGVTWVDPPDSSANVAMVSGVQAYAAYKLDKNNLSYAPKAVLWFEGDETDTVECVKFKENSCAAGDDCSVYDETQNTLYDGRDDRTYKTTTINGQVWMAENLNYGVDNSFCYYDDETNCETFGRLYTWNAAMKGSSVAETRGVCPLGWHVPSKDEWDELGKFVVLDNKSVGGKSGIDFDNDKSPLRAESFWKSQYAGSDKYGFSILPGGIFFMNTYDKLGDGAYFWTSTCDSSTGTRTSYFPYEVEFYEDKDFEFINDPESDIAFSLRCIKDSD
ncbi:MAG: hypothetical protein MJY99_11255 [Fibrobacter sp.]|nr:hypothetical protein [Fibrobacter sp.]